jgi:AraC-like DNA-binding protein/quercetin dioxygenase-like cupin family protein
MTNKTTADYIRELEIALEYANNTSSQITFYFQDMETNPLKNVVTTEIRRDEVTAYHKHDFYEVNYVFEGTLHQNISGRYFSLSKGELLIMSPGVFHACVPDANTFSINILFEKEWFSRSSEAFKKYDPNNYLSSLAENTVYTVISAGEYEKGLEDIIRNLYKRVMGIVHHVDLYENLSAENNAIELLLYLTKIPRQEFNFTTDSTKKREMYTPDDIVRYINDNFSKISLPDTAQKFGYSESQLHRILKKHTGYSFSELILHMRMQRARHYLLNTHLPIKNIAHILGLDSAEHFSRMFKKNRGMTPKEYREQFMRVSLKKAK